MMRQVILHRNQIHEGHLVLVNRRHPIRRERLAGKPNLVPCIHQTDILLERRAAACLTQLIQAVGGGKDIKLVSGYRSREDQERLFLDSLREHGREFTEQYVAYPGCSEHETGLAIDLGENRPGFDFIRPSFPDTGIFADFRRKAADFGFVERYAKGKEQYTGIAHEPWHFRYVGYPHARIMVQNGFCLEEYITFLRDFPLGGQPLAYREESRFDIYYVAANGDEIRLELPEHRWNQISGNNVDGFIVTLWRDGQ